jgi:hypothetical protein
MKPHGPCGLRGLVQPTVVFAHRIAASFVAHTSLPRGAGAESSNCRRMEHGKPCVCVSQEQRLSSHRVESLAVSLRQRAKTSESPLRADKQLRHILHCKELSNFRNESDLLCCWPQVLEGPSSFVSSCHYPESNTDLGINWLLPVA